MSGVWETIGDERAENGIFWGFTKHGEVRKNPQEPAKTRVNATEHAGTGEKNPTGEPVGFSIWWSWGDLNPRPQAIFEQIYMFSGLI